MNIRDLKYLVSVAELKNFSAAAKQCFVSQPTLSSQIKKLEESLGVTIFERTNKKVIATAIGNQLVVSAKKILSEVELMADIAESSINPLSGRFRLGAMPTLAAYIFPSIIEPIKSEMPELKLILLEEKTDKLLERLNQGKVDAALLALPVDNSLFETKKLFDDYFFLAVQKGHQLCSKKNVDQNSLLENKLLLLEEGHCLRDHALEICDLVGASEEADFRATSLETLRQMVKAGTGITLMPEIAINDEQDICYLPFQSPRPKRTIGLVWRKTSTKQKVIESLLRILIR